MSFFKSVLRAFGFGSDDSNYDEEEVVTQPAPSAVEVSAHDDAAVSPGELPAAFFDVILEVFNNSQPDFVRSCLDREAQRRYLYDALGTSFKEYLSGCRADMEREFSEKARGEARKYREEISGLREKCKSAEEKEEGWNQQRLSADRQKRALSDKIQELERQVNGLEAEKEQFILENRSLVNKIKVAEVREADASDAADAELSRRLAESEAVCEKMTAEVERLNAEVLENAELYKTKMSMSDKMLSDIRNANAELRKESDASQARVQELSDRLEQARVDMEMAEEINKKITKIEQLLDKRDAKIRDLKAEKQELEVKVKSLEKEIATLKLSLESSMATQVAAEIELKKVQESAPVEEAAAPSVKSRRRKKATPKISAIDESLDSTEWLVATPPAGMVAKATGVVSDAEFGYQEPPRRQSHDNDAQMSLF